MGEGVNEKYAPARVALLLEIASLRPPNQKRSDLFNPFSIPSTSKLRRVTALFLLGRERFISLFFHCSFVADFDIPKETIEDAKSFQRTARQRKKVYFLLTLRRSRDISIGRLGIVWNKKEPKFSKARWTC
jgi:hypothetical protein